jgi:hypothetical protein
MDNYATHKHPKVKDWHAGPLHTGADLLMDKQHQRLTNLFAVDEHIEVEATWGSTSA